MLGGCLAPAKDTGGPIGKDLETEKAEEDLLGRLNWNLQLSGNIIQRQVV